MFKPIRLLLPVSLILLSGCAGNHSGYVGTEADWSPKAQIVDGNNQSAPVNTTFAKALKIRLTMYNGDPMPGHVVRFWAPSSGASCTFPGGGVEYTSVTDDNAMIEAPAPTANGVAGSYTVQVAATGMVPGSIRLTNQ